MAAMQRGRGERAVVLAAAATVVCQLPVFLAAAMTLYVSSELRFSVVAHGASLGAFFGAMALGSVPLGRTADRLGATASLRVACLLASIASFSIAVAARNWATFTVGLVVAGGATALAQPAANRLLVKRVPLSRLATAFGVKQSAPPTASMLAGLAVPAVALTVGWRWAYLIAAVGALIMALYLKPNSTRPVGVVSSPRGYGELPPLRQRSTLLLLAAGLGLGFASSSSVLAFIVRSLVDAGASEHRAGLVFALASFAAIATRLAAGVACDRTAVPPLRLCVYLLIVGGVGLALLAAPGTANASLGAVLALAGTWGFPGVFWYGLVVSYREAPGRVTGMMAPAALGGVVGPIAFGGVLASTSFPIAWRSAAVVTVASAAVLSAGAKRLGGWSRPFPQRV